MIFQMHNKKIISKQCIYSTGYENDVIENCKNILENCLTTTNKSF